MNIRRTQIVLITFAVASWLGAVLELGAAASCGGDDCMGAGPPRQVEGRIGVVALKDTEGNAFTLTQGEDSSRESSPHSSPASPSAAR